MNRPTKPFSTSALAIISLLLSLPSDAIPAEVVVIVSVKNPVASLDSAQLANIFLGKTNRFPNGTPALPVDQAEDSPKRHEFYANYLGRSAAQVKSHWSKIIFTGRGQPPKTALNDDAVKKLVTGNPNAIGYIDEASVDETVKVISRRNSNQL